MLGGDTPDHLKTYKILRTKSSRIFDELAVCTAKMFNTQIAVINFVDQYSIWNKKVSQVNKYPGLHTGTNVCSLAIINENVGAFKDLHVPTLMTNALIAAEHGMCFYASVAITNNEGIQIGSVCIADQQRRSFLPGEQEKLEWVAELIKKEMSKKTAGKLCA